MTTTQKIRHVLRHPSHALWFAQFQLLRLAHRGEAECCLHGSAHLTGYRRYSEWQGIRQCVSKPEYTLLRRLLLSLGGGEVLDVGAHVGAFSLLIHPIVPERRIHCFEPSPANVERLARNLERNGARGIAIVAAAVTAASGRVAFGIMADSSAKGRLYEGKGQRIEVPAWSLDDYCAARGLAQVAFVKVDVEGYEAEVFRGAAQLLSAHRLECIYFEVCPELGQILGRDPRVPTRLLQEQGYHVHRIGGDGLLHPWRESEARRIPLENLVALSPAGRARAAGLLAR